MADFLDDLIGLQKEFKAITDDIETETADLRGVSVDKKAAELWSPGDYKVVPKANVSMCVRCLEPEASCDLCEQVCPTNAIEFTDDGDVDITSDCRKCGLCVAACPTDALTSTLYSPRIAYDKICKAAEANEMVYVTCTRSLKHAPADGMVVLPCVGAISAETWYAILCEYGNVGVYLPPHICDKCRTTGGEDFYTEQIGCGESWSGETVDLETKEKNLVLEVDHKIERKQFVSSTAKSLGMTAASVTPLTAKLARAGQKIAAHSKQITNLQKALDRMCGGANSEEKARVLVPRRQLLLVALADHPDTAENILFDLPQMTDACTGCGTCAELCPTRAIDIKDGKATVVSSHCVTCSLCADVCPEEGAVEFVEVDARRLIVDDPETRKKVADKEREAKQREEARQKTKEYGKKALDFLEGQADIIEEEEREEAQRKAEHAAKPKAKASAHEADGEKA
ncbi:MAG: 4Fe-4S binding protein [Coriobacteriia bacterium]|nr:4Fe-4S binding protein [Coriobacteriia bacterium]MBS5478748.1 4Fe-4S binding protein [Coriobacteriia bacterium]